MNSALIRAHVKAATEAYFKIEAKQRPSIRSFHRTRCIHKPVLLRKSQSKAALLLLDGDTQKYNVSVFTLTKAIRAAKENGERYSTFRHGGHRTPLHADEEDVLVERLKENEIQLGYLTRRMVQDERQTSACSE